MLGFSRRSVLAGLGAVLAAPALAQPRSPAWAVPVALDGAPNLYRITPALYRAAQPTTAGFTALADLGVTTVISMRQTVDDADVTSDPRLRLLRVPMKSRHVGDDDGAQVVQVMQLILQAQGPVLLHCHHGADRTGTICAVYRMVVQGWTHEAALDELLNGGYGFHTIWDNIPEYVSSLDINDMRRRIGVDPT